MVNGKSAVWLLHQPLVAWLSFFAMIVAGFFALGHLHADFPGQLIYPQIKIRIQAPGLPGDIIDTRITQAAEAVIEGLPAVHQQLSTSSDGLAEITLYFNRAREMRQALTLLEERMSRLRQLMPGDVTAVSLVPRRGAPLAVAEVVVSSSNRTPDELRRWVENNLSKQFLEIPGIDNVEIEGGAAREVQILPDQRRVAAYGLSWETLIAAVRANTLGSTTPWTVAEGAAALTVAGLPVRLASGDDVALSELAEVREALEEAPRHWRYNSKPVIKLSLTHLPDAGAIPSAEAVKARLGWLQTNNLLPKDISVQLLAGPSFVLKRMLGSFVVLMFSMALWAMLVGGLQRGRKLAVALTAVSIPLGMAVAAAALAMAGISANVMSLSGLLLGSLLVVGLTDFSLALMAYRRQACTAEEAAQRAWQVVLTTGLCIAAVLLPFFPLSGLMGVVFRELVIALAFATLSAMLVAILVVPLVVVRARKSPSVPKLRLAQTFFSRPRMALLLAIVMILALPLYAWLPSAGPAFLPPLESGHINIRVSANAGISDAQIQTWVDALEISAREQGEVWHILTAVGISQAGHPQAANAQRALLHVELLPEAQRAQHTQAWIRHFNQNLRASALAGIDTHVSAELFPGTQWRRFEDPILRAAEGELAIRVLGPDRQVLSHVGEQLITRLQNSPGIQAPRRSAGETVQELVPVMNTQAANGKQIDEIAVARVLRMARGGLVVGKILEGDQPVSVRLLLPTRSGDARQALSQLLLRGESAQQPALYLHQVAQLQPAKRALELRRQDQVPMIEISSLFAAPQALSSVLATLRAQLSAVSLPAGYRLSLAGVPQVLEDGIQHMLQLVLLSLCLLLAVLVVRFRSWQAPLVVGLNLVCSLGGLVWGLLFSEFGFSLPVGMAALLLMGFSTLQATWVLEAIALGAKSGESWQRRILHGVETVWRPLLKLNLVALLLCALLGMGMARGFELLQPLAITLMSGIFAAGLSSVLIVPAFYRWLMNRAR